jgi:hypothetical protein
MLLPTLVHEPYLAGVGTEPSERRCSILLYCIGWCGLRLPSRGDARPPEPEIYLVVTLFSLVTKLPPIMRGTYVAAYTGTDDVASKRGYNAF